jgi:uncharacterized protein involved in response to NO
MQTIDTITAEMFLPEVVERFPSTRAVLDRYGLKGCGGPQGPAEPVSWFARLHGVPLDRLLRELNETAKNPDTMDVRTERSIADTIYRPFFVAGISTLLTLGCMWGAINLLTIGLSQNFSAIKYSWTLAHGHAMVTGFVGFFIMGFAYQAFPRFKHANLWKPRLAFSSLPLMAAGIILQTAAHLSVPSRASMPVEIVAASLQLAAVIIFAVAIVKTARQAKKPEVYDRFVYAALAWFVVAAIANPIIFKLFEFPATREQLLFNLATFNIPYRDVQLIGVAVIMILGVSLRFLPHAYGLREPSKAWRNFLFWGLNLALIMGATSFIAGMTSGNHRLVMVQWLSGIALLIVAVGTPRQFRLFGSVPANEQDRGLKFIRAAYVWFIIATAMLVFVPIYNFGIYMPITGSHVPFSHAFFGAYRHSITVGFILMMIVGVSSKVVPTLSGVDVRRAPSLWPTFILLNAGNAMRVSFQIATDFTPSAYPIMGVSGFIEVVGLTLWSYELISNMRVGKKLEKHATEILVQLPSLTIKPQTLVSDVLRSYPQSLDVFLKHGFTPLSNPILRRTMARVVTVEQACRREGVDLNSLLTELRSVSSGEQSRAVQITRS